MLNRSDQYNKMMRSDLRGCTTASIYIGAVNQQAQSGAAVGGDFWQWNAPEAVLNPDITIDKRYLTWEQKHNRLDGTIYFLPEQEEVSDRPAGAVTREICTPQNHPLILFQFAVSHLRVKGLTIQFGASYPKTFTIETGPDEAGIRHYAADSGNFVTEDLFEDVSYMKIIPGMMSNGATRFHIESILFGIGIYLTGRKIISMKIKEKTHPISLELPTVDFQFILDNQDRYFNANREDSVINYLERGQQVRAYFMQTLEDGATEIIPAVSAVLDTTWKDKYSTAEFSATDCIYQMDAVYEKGLYRKEGVSAEWLLTELFACAGIPEEQYEIDPYLKTVMIRNPLPRDTCANNILLIANACRCVMTVDREDRVIIRVAFWPDLSTDASEGTGWSRADMLLKQADVAEYLDWEQAHNRIDGALRIQPEDGNHAYAGFISSGLSDAEGYFENDPVITIHASAAFNFYQLSIWFGNVYPKEGIISSYRDHALAERFQVDFSGGQKVIINHAFVNVDEVQIMFTKAAPYNRIHVHRLSVDEETDFTISRSNMLEQPTTVRADRLKALNVMRSIYSLPSQTEDIYTDAVRVSRDRSTFRIEFNDASVPVRVITTVSAPADDEIQDEIEVDYGAEITESSNWYCCICFRDPPQELQDVSLRIEGFVYHISNQQYTIGVNSTGTTPETLVNPLIDTAEFADLYARWCAQYYQAKAEYSVKRFMGDPVLESNDLAYFEDEDASRKLIRVHTIETKFDGTYNNSSLEGRSTEEI